MIGQFYKFHFNNTRQRKAQEGTISCAKDVLTKVTNLILLEDQHNLINFTELAKKTATQAK